MCYQSDTNMQTICHTNVIVKGDSFGSETWVQIFRWQMVFDWSYIWDDREG